MVADPISLNKRQAPDPFIRVGGPQSDKQKIARRRFSVLVRRSADMQ